MGVELPQLDDRTYEELRADAEALLAAHGGEWTDHAAHDPGITVLELLAWLTETYGYQLDRITDDHREKFLKLLGDRPRPPEPAKAVLSLSSDAATPVAFPSGTPLSASEDGNRYRFETTHDLTVTGTRIERVLAGRIDVTSENSRESGSFRAFGDEPTAGDALYLGFDAEPFETADTLTLWLDIHDKLPDPAPGRFEPSVELVWERYCPRTGAWRPLGVRHDGSDACYRSGRVTLACRPEGAPGPAENPENAPGIVDDPDPPGDADLAWLRCRLETADYEFPPELSAVRTDCVAVRHGRTVSGERLTPEHEAGTPRGLDGQTYAFEQTPVRDATVTVGGREWTPVPDFDAAGPDDRVYVLDREAGTVTFGDGIHGAVPDPDATVRADYTSGGGVSANVSADASWTPAPEASVSDPNLNVQITPLSGAAGGRDGESVTAALERARRAQGQRQRAVTPADYREIVSRTPGTRIARTDVCLDGDATTVVIVPFAPADVRRPQPSDGLLAAVREHLADRTLLGETVTVRGPRYVDLDFEVVARTRADTDEAAVETAVSRFVHPLAGEGWSFGQSLRPDAVSEMLADCDGVDRVVDVTVTSRRPTPGVGEAIELDDRSLFAVADVTLSTPREGFRP